MEHESSPPPGPHPWASLRGVGCGFVDFFIVGFADDEDRLLPEGKADGQPCGLATTFPTGVSLAHNVHRHRASSFGSSALPWLLLRPGLEVRWQVALLLQPLHRLLVLLLMAMPKDFRPLFPYELKNNEIRVYTDGTIGFVLEGKVNIKLSTAGEPMLGD